jgi:TATA-binding related factor (TRF) of subunit 20 of Mediator complex
MDTGWQERQGTTVNLEGRGFEWGRDWRIWCANFQQGNRYRGVVVEVQYMPCDSLPASKLLLTEFAERHIFRSGESVRPFWGRRIYQNLGKQGEEQPKDEREFEDWHTALQYIEMVQYASVARRKSSID